MHDPMTVAFDIPNPFARRYEWAKRWSGRPALITVWHVDPERGGDDDSCRRAYQLKRPTETTAAVAEVLWDGETRFDNRPHFPDSPEHKWFQKLKDAVHRDRLRTTFWRCHPRWHVWHWRVQVHPLQSLRRQLLSRCEVCGGRFKAGASVVGRGWGSSPRRWLESFRGERDVRHMSCDTANVKAGAV